MHCPKPSCALRLFALLCIVSIYSTPVCAQGIYQNWGTTYPGGKDLIGAIFSTDSSGGNLIGRYSFKYINKGANPTFGHMTPFNGKLYGLCSGIVYGAQSSIFEYDPVTGQYTQKVVFDGNNGNVAEGSLTLYNNQFYGVTSEGGTNNVGVLFKYDPATNIYAKLFDMVDSTGNYPTGDLILFNNKMYGLASGGGNSGGGVLFEYDPVSGIYTKKIDVNDGFGRFPNGSLTIYNNKFYGMTFAGGHGFESAGTLFEYDPNSNVYTDKVDFTQATGRFPNGSLLVVGDKLWGFTNRGGNNDLGVIFQYDPATNSYTKKIDLTQADGARPFGDPVISNNKLLGLTTEGGTNDMGVLFEYDPILNTYTKKVDLSNINGANPAGSLIFFNNTFYGYTGNGGSGDAGVIFEYNPATAVYTKKIDFNSSISSFPSSSLTYFDKNLYGLTETGGTTGTGVLFKYDLTTNTTSTEINFDTLNGSYPMGDLVAYNNKLYAMTKGGGIYDRGVLFSYDPIAKIYAKLFDFDSVRGGNPLDFREILYISSPLLLFNNKFYGTTHFGGINNTGVLFEFDPATNVYTKKFDFDYASGKEPSGGLVAVNGKLYGTTAHGGTTDKGVLFEYDPASNVYTKKHDFQLPDDLSQQAGLSLFTNNKLYGVSAYGGDGDFYGFLFEFDPATNTYTRKLNFDSATGDFPLSRLMLRNNLFYGMTFSGGVYNGGVVYEYNPLTNVYTKKADFDGINTGGGVDATSLISIPASVADGNIGSCTSLSSFIIDNANNNEWKGLTDQNGNAVAEINANGNNLGTITASLYVQNNPVRIAGGLNYLNRSLTITVQNQPAAGQPVDVRLYIKKTELDDLINTPNSGINSVNDLLVYKSENTCSNTIGTDVVKLTTSATEWGANYVLTTQVNSFSTFHFSSANAALPVTLLNFTATRKNKNENLLNWETSAETNSDYFSIQRSVDGSQFVTAGKLLASGNSSIKKQYQFVDAYAATTEIFYRLKMVDKDGKFKYSKIVKLSGGNAAGIVVSPNPVLNTLSIQGATQFSQVQIIDASGKTIRQFSAAPGNQYKVSDLRSGIYILRLINDKETVITRFVKL